MKSPAAFARASGDGPAVVCLHSSGASSRQWDALAARLAGRHRVVAADLAGHGRSPGWGAHEAPSLAGEVARLLPVVADLERFHLVGHSYGGAVAVKLALALPGRVASLAVFEPVMFRLLLDGPGADPAGEEVLRVAGAMRAALAAGEAGRAAEAFVDYWNGEGAWSGTAPEARETIASRMDAVMANFDALFHDATPPRRLAALEVPALLISGTASPASSRGVAARLAATLPRLRHRVLDGVGHMGPLTHADWVHALLEEFVAAQSAPDRDASALPLWTMRSAFA